MVLSFIPRMHQIRHTVQDSLTTHKLYHSDFVGVGLGGVKPEAEYAYTPPWAVEFIVSELVVFTR